MFYLITKLSEVSLRALHQRSTPTPPPPPSHTHTETCSPHTHTTACSANKSICTYKSSNNYPIGWVGFATVHHQCKNKKNTVFRQACTFTCMLQLRTVHPVRSALPAQVDSWMDGWVGGWIDGWFEGWVRGRVGGWIDR